MASDLRAAELPEGSVVATEHSVWLKFRCAEGALNWRTTSGASARDRVVDEALTNGAQVLRVGTGREG